ncbi:hypothetical protein [Fodinicola feengrottensis]|uniref:hypothetical protein n=1 Tax=Fodinicola feengrottensis TaxID=435914 RepID=UPI0013D87786|nr:hypothetical protein [Fodinicola feengrottensis]
MLEFYDQIHRENQLRSLTEITARGNQSPMALGLGTTAVNDILTGKRQPVDEKQAAALARALGGGTDEAEHVEKLFRSARLDKYKRPAKTREPGGPGTAELDATGLDGTGLNRTGLDRTGLDRTGLDRTGLDAIANLLADAMRKQWLTAAHDRGLLLPAPLPVRWRRSTEPVAGAVSQATQFRDDGSSFDPLPGFTRVTAHRLREGGRDGLLNVYGGLASGRLIIAGGPGRKELGGGASAAGRAWPPRPADGSRAYEGTGPGSVHPRRLGSDGHAGGGLAERKNSARSRSFAAVAAIGSAANCSIRDGYRCSWTASTRCPSPPAFARCRP